MKKGGPSLRDRIDVPLDLKGFEVTGTEVVCGVLEVEVRSTRRPACHHCGSLDVTSHATNERRIRDRGCGYPTVLRWRQRRLLCADCGKTCRERHPEVAGRCAVTHRFRRRLFERACHEPFTDVASSETVSCYRVQEAFEHHADAELAAREIAPPRVLAIDESAFRRPHRYHTVFSDPERGAVIELVEGHGRGAVYGGLAAMSDQLRGHIETVTMDCHWPYRKAVEEVLPDVRIVADKFHVIRCIDTAAQRVRIHHGRRSRPLGPDGVASRRQRAFLPGVHRGRRTFMRRSHKLSAAERASLTALFDDIPVVGVAWLLKEEFAAIYEAPDRAEAERRLQVWVDHINEAGLPEFTKVWQQLQPWVEPILAYFDDPVTNAFAEGITNKIKVIKRRSYGFRNPVRYRHKVLLSCASRSSRDG
jgi:transposase